MRIRIRNPASHGKNVEGSVVNPEWFQCGSGCCILGPSGSGSKNCKILLVEKKFTVFFILRLTTHLSLGLHEKRPSYRRTLLPSKENMYKFENEPLEIYLISRIVLKR
jgi:hypothetical protein